MPPLHPLHPLHPLLPLRPFPIQHLERPELWVGPEASVVRTHDRHTDQLVSTGFAQRLDDLDRLAALGATRIRMPVLWERTEAAPGVLDFSWADARLQHLQAGPMRPVIGLLHHGSGPPHTDLLDPAFPAKLADYAGSVAARYPWVDAWTPVNEPLTTARFSGLYGLWFPHRRDDAAFVRALLHQVQGTRLAMQRIRAVNPQAMLVQTEDLGRTHGTQPLAAQVRFDNHRRWLSLDLLHGRVGPAHPLWRYLLQAGATQAELQALHEDPTPPGIVGINHYITSDRFLDHRLPHYPRHTYGHNARQAYADVEAVRVRGAAPGGFEARLREAAARYGSPLAACPLAITEVQLGCTREEQLRWFHEAWQAAARLRQDGVDLRAVTAWATFGAHDWDSLLTRERGHYEPGLFDVRGPQPRPTALATLVQELAQGRAPSHPVLQSPGWWHREERHVYPPHGAMQSRAPRGAPVLITGARGTLGQAFARLCRLRGLPYHLMGRDQMDIADAASVDAALQRLAPWAVVNAAGFVRVDDAEHDPQHWRDNALGPIVLAETCARHGIPVLTFSSDLVFDGGQRHPYGEGDSAHPLNAYGRAKQHVEKALQQQPQALVVRTAAFFGPWDEHNFITQGLGALRRGEPWRAVDDQTVSPTYVPDLVHASLDLLIDGEQGLWHLANQGAVTWHALACRAAEAAGLPRHLVHRIDSSEARQRAPRPAYSALTSERGAVMPALDLALQRFLDATAAGGVPEPPSASFGACALRAAA